MNAGRPVLAAARLHYRVAGTVPGRLPGAHPGRVHGPGAQPAGWRALFDDPDARRLDVRASLRDPHRRWLVRSHRQLSRMRVWMLADASASMEGDGRVLAARFARLLADSAHAYGDAVGLVAFDAGSGIRLFDPPRRGAGRGDELAGALLGLGPSAQRAMPDAGDGLLAAVHACGVRADLMFWWSDFPWPVPVIDRALQAAAAARVVPLWLRHPQDHEPPARNGWLELRDAETGSVRALWLNDARRRAWRDAAQARTQALHAVFARHGTRPVGIDGALPVDAINREFVQGAA